MFYYLFKVRTNKPDIVPDYYVLNNRYIGYVGCDVASKHIIRSMLEYNAKVSTKLQFQLYATVDFINDNELHELFCGGERFDLKVVEEIVNKYKFKQTSDNTWYGEYYPSRNSSRSLLKSVDGSRIILDGGLIVTAEEFKKNRKRYLE